jgi:colanic acid biosynthesis glycosyl transferase WcaI
MERQLEGIASSKGDRKSILFLNRVYPPVPGATGEMLRGMAEGLVERGHEVTVVTSGRTDLPPSSVVNGVRIERVGSSDIDRSSHVRRGLHYAALYPLFLQKALTLPRHDVVVTKTDPPMLAILGPVIAGLKGSRTIHWAQDVYPELAGALGVIDTEGMLYRSLLALSTWALRRHDAIVAVGRCMKEKIAERGIDPDRIHVIPNWADPDIRPISHAENPFRQEHGLDGKFVVMYSGNMGLAHPFEEVLDAAEELSSDQDVVFLFIGDGPRKASLEQAVRERRLTNVRFLPFQPRERLSESLSAGDVHIVTMEEEVAGLVVPSKIYGILAVGRPYVFLGPQYSEAAMTAAEAEGTRQNETDAATRVVPMILQFRSSKHEEGWRTRTIRLQGTDQFQGLVSRISLIARGSM